MVMPAADRGARGAPEETVRLLRALLPAESLRQLVAADRRRRVRSWRSSASASSLTRGSLAVPDDPNAGASSYNTQAWWLARAARFRGKCRAATRAEPG